MNLPISLRGGVDRLPDLLESITARINTIWGKEHNVDGTHGAVTADSITAGSITTSDSTVGNMAVDDLTVGDDLSVVDDVTVGGDIVTTGTLTNRLWHRIVAGDGPRLKLDAEIQAVDARQFQIVNNNQTLRIQAVNDAETITQGSVTMSRTGVFTALAGLGATPINAANLSGTMPAASLPANVALKDAINTFTTHNTIQGNLQVDGAAYILGAELYSLNGFRERSRPAALGVWTNIPHNAANFYGAAPLVWTVGGANYASNSYTLIGNTCIWTVHIINATLSGSPNYILYINAPVASAVSNDVCVGHLWLSAEGGWQTCSVVYEAGSNRVAIHKANFSNYGSPQMYLRFTLTYRIA